MTIQTPSLSSLFSLYVHLRQCGRSMDATVQDLQDEVYRLPRDERRQLGQCVTEWEEKYGNAPSGVPAPKTTQSVPVVQTVAPAAPVIQMEPPTPKPASPKVFGTRLLDPSMLPEALRQAIQPPIPSPIHPCDLSVKCPYCGKANSSSSMQCQACGRSLQLGATRRFEAPEQTAANSPLNAPAYFSETGTLILTLLDKRILQAYPCEKIIIGRSGNAAESPQVNIDLAAYNGAQLGVSRLHAEIRVQNQMLLLLDLNSTNGTFVNDLRLHPFEARVLRTGDELRFGRLSMKVSFKN